MIQKVIRMKSFVFVIFRFVFQTHLIIIIKCSMNIYLHRIFIYFHRGES